jgi:hypothetical protein
MLVFLYQNALELNYFEGLEYIVVLIVKVILECTSRDAHKQGV